jgi:hypothetical protein
MLLCFYAFSEHCTNARCPPHRVEDSRSTRPSRLRLLFAAQQLQARRNRLRGSELERAKSEQLARRLRSCAAHRWAAMCHAVQGLPRTHRLTSPPTFDTRQSSRCQPERRDTWLTFLRRPSSKQRFSRPAREFSFGPVGPVCARDASVALDHRRGLRVGLGLVHGAPRYATTCELLRHLDVRSVYQRPCLARCSCCFSERGGSNHRRTRDLAQPRDNRKGDGGPQRAQAICLRVLRRDGSVLLRRPGQL